VCGGRLADGVIRLPVATGTHALEAPGSQHKAPQDGAGNEGEHEAGNADAESEPPLGERDTLAVVAAVIVVVAALGVVEALWGVLGVGPEASLIHLMVLALVGEKNLHLVGDAAVAGALKVALAVLRLGAQKTKVQRAVGDAGVDHATRGFCGWEVKKLSDMLDSGKGRGRRTRTSPGQSPSKLQGWAATQAKANARRAQIE